MKFTGFGRNVAALSAAAMILAACSGKDEEVAPTTAPAPAPVEEKMPEVTPPSAHELAIEALNNTGTLTADQWVLLVTVTFDLDFQTVSLTQNIGCLAQRRHCITGKL